MKQERGTGSGLAARPRKSVPPKIARGLGCGGVVVGRQDKLLSVGLCYNHLLNEGNCSNFISSLEGAPRAPV